MGRYVDGSLGPGEHVILETRNHWIIFWFPMAILSLWIMPAIARWSSEFAITNRRIVIKTGFIRLHTLELNEHQVESVSVDQGLLGRMLGYGTVIIAGNGGTREAFHHIAQPLAFRRAYQHQLG